MEHNLFETWIIDQVELNSEQEYALQQHLLDCSTCQRLQRNLQAAILSIQTSTPVAPEPGFSRRWNDSLAHRRAQQQAKQISFTRNILLVGLLFLLAMLVGYSLLITSPMRLLVSGMQNVMSLVLCWNQLGRIAFNLISALPPIIPLAIWVLLSTGLAGLSLFWVLTLWRISRQGVGNYETKT